MVYYGVYYAVYDVVYYAVYDVVYYEDYDVFYYKLFVPIFKYTAFNFSKSRPKLRGELRRILRSLLSQFLM